MHDIVFVGNANDETEATILSMANTDTPNKGEDLTVTATFKLSKQEHIRHIIDCEECKETTDAVACKLVASQTAFKEYTPKGIYKMRLNHDHSNTMLMRVREKEILT